MDFELTIRFWVDKEIYIYSFVYDEDSEYDGDVQFYDYDNKCVALSKEDAYGEINKKISGLEMLELGHSVDLHFGDTNSYTYKHPHGSKQTVLDIVARCTELNRFEFRKPFMNIDKSGGEE